jgi:aspartyl-tRNA(Asn)/glutamyl-tRNA(Gln) amidotransferase subunit A
MEGDGRNIMTSQDLCYTPATELSRLIRSRQLSPVELTEAMLARIEQLNPTLNAYCTVTAELAMQQARAAEQAVMDDKTLGLLHGLPMSIKDLTATKGIPTMRGSHIFADSVPDFDAPAYTRLLDAGAIMLGKTTTPEFGWKGCSDSPLTGATHNPWKHGMNAGASSAGAGAAAAAGLGVLHQGSDGAGSIRMPSCFCGIYGLKPSYGRVPYYPTPNNDYGSHIGPMTRTVADSALMLAAMAGPHEWDRTTLEGEPADYVGALDNGIGGLTVAFSPNLGNLPVDDEVAGPVRRAAEAFSELGCRVDEIADPGFDDSWELIRFFWSTHIAGNYSRYLKDWESKMDPGMVACIRHGLQFSAVEYVEMREHKLAYWDNIRRLFERYDLLLTPTTSVAAFPVNRLYPEHYAEHDWDWIRWAGFSYPFNFTGQPAATVPCGFTPAGLPVGLQIVGRRFADLTVLQASRAFEQIRPWADKTPDL